MQPAAIVEGLQTQIEKIRERAESEIGILWGAIELIQGRASAAVGIPEELRISPPARTARPEAPTPGPAAPATLTIPEMILKAAEAIGDKILDFAPLRDKAVSLYPDDEEKIKRGIYPAMKSLTERKKLVKVCGGWKLPQFVQPGDVPGPKVTPA